MTQQELPFDKREYARRCEAIENMQTDLLTPRKLDLVKRLIRDVFKLKRSSAEGDLTFVRNEIPNRPHQFSLSAYLLCSKRALENWLGWAKAIGVISISIDCDSFGDRRTTVSLNWNQIFALSAAHFGAYQSACSVDQSACSVDQSASSVDQSACPALSSNNNKTILPPPPRRERAAAEGFCESTSVPTPTLATKGGRPGSPGWALSGSLGATPWQLVRTASRPDPDRVRRRLAIAELLKPLLERWEPLSHEFADRDPADIEQAIRAYRANQRRCGPGALVDLLRTGAPPIEGWIDPDKRAEALEVAREKRAAEEAAAAAAEAATERRQRELRAIWDGLPADERTCRIRDVKRQNRFVARLADDSPLLIELAMATDGIEEQK